MPDKKYHAITEEQLSKLIELLELGLTTDGGHHKQWALVEDALHRLLQSYLEFK